MTEPFNSASRVYGFLMKARGVNGNTLTKDAWATVFEIEEPDGIEKQYRVMDMLQALYDEARLAHSAAFKTTIPRTKYENAFSAIHASLDPSLFTGAFSNVIQHYHPETMTALNFLISLIEQD